MKMGTVKKGSYPSKQIRAGPAPLASFEDLPSDEMDSPENGKLEDDNEDTGSVKLVGVDGYTIGDAETPTPGTLTPNGIGSPLETGNITPTPSHSGTPVVEIREGGGGGGVTPTLLHPEGTDSAVSGTESQRKGSWTDIFHPRSRNRSRSVSPHQAEGALLSPSSPSTHLKGRDDNESIEDEASRKRREKKGFFTSIFKLSGRKSPGKELLSPVKYGDSLSAPTPTDNKATNQDFDMHAPKSQAQTKDVVTVEKSDLFTGRSASKGSLHLPLQEAQVARSEPIENADTIGDNSKNVEESSSSVNVCKGVDSTEDVESKTGAKDQGDIATKPERPDSSESELEFDTKADSLKKTESDEDFEAATLLVQDSMEYDDTSISDIPPPPVDTSRSLVKTPTRRQRLEVITIPIERPRSTTPINIAPLEAFLQTASPSSECGGEKIKLSLPGEKFASRPRSPRKGNPKSWFDFCEEGLQSPRSHRRQSAAKAGFQALDDATPLSEGGDKTFPSTPETDLFLQDMTGTEKQQWTTFGSFKDESELNRMTQDAASLQESDTVVDQTKFSDKFGDFFEPDAFSTSQNLATKNSWHPSDCSCECHTCSCDCHYVIVPEASQGNAATEKRTQDPVQISKHINDADTCPCDCHCQAVPVKPNEQHVFGSSSDISSSSRRFSADSSPSPYSSQDEELHGPKNLKC